MLARIEYSETWAWFMSGDQEGMFAYEVLCCEVGYQPSKMRERLLADLVRGELVCLDYQETGSMRETG